MKVIISLLGHFLHDDAARAGIYEFRTELLMVQRVFIVSGSWVFIDCKVDNLWTEVGGFGFYFGFFDHLL